MDKYKKFFTILSVVMFLGSGAMLVLTTLNVMDAKRLTAEAGENYQKYMKLSAEVRRALEAKNLAGMTVAMSTDYSSSNTDSGAIFFQALIDEGAQRAGSDAADILVVSSSDTTIGIKDRWGNSMQKDIKNAENYAHELAQTLGTERRVALLYPIKNKGKYVQTDSGQEYGDVSAGNMEGGDTGTENAVPRDPSGQSATDGAASGNPDHPDNSAPGSADAAAEKAAKEKKSADKAIGSN